MKKKSLTVIGMGMGDASLILPAAKAAIAASDKVYTTKGLDKRLSGYGASVSIEELYALLASVNSSPRATAVLVSGDAGFFSLSKGLWERFSSLYDIRIINGLNTMQYFCGKLGIPYDNIPAVSMHGRDICIAAKVSYNPRLFVLTGGSNKAHVICQELTRCGLGGVRVHVGEHLSYENERVLSGPASELAQIEYSGLAVMVIENEGYRSPHIPLSDGDFIRGSAPMTKFDIRQAVLARLKIQPAHVLYDIGAGTGAVSVEMARKAFDGVVYAIEKDREACGLIKENRHQHGAFNLEVLEGEAGHMLATCHLPVPDAAFIGGSTGNMKVIVQALIKQNPQVRIVVTAVTLQTVADAMGLSDIVAIKDITCMNAATAKKLGRYDLMTAQNPVYIFTLQNSRCN